MIVYKTTCLILNVTIFSQGALFFFFFFFDKVSKGVFSVYVCKAFSWRLEHRPLLTTPHISTYTCRVTTIPRVRGGEHDAFSFLLIIIIIFTGALNNRDFPSTHFHQKSRCTL